MGHTFRKAKEGFTIIEVMIVLAIAGLIMLIVLVAIPQLQRNQRNSARRDVAGRIVGELNNYAGNNNGNFPAENLASGATNFGTASTALGFWNRYLGCNGATPPVCTTNINDPRTGQPVGTGADGGNNLTTVVNADPGTTPGSVSYDLGSVCNGEVRAAGSNRTFTFQMRLEGGAIICLDND